MAQTAPPPQPIPVPPVEGPSGLGLGVDPLLLALGVLAAGALVYFLVRNKNNNSEQPGLRRDSDFAQFRREGVMKSGFVVRAAAGLAAMTALPGIAFAQAWVPGSEIVGQPIQVTTNGTTNTIYLDQGGAARHHDAGRQHHSGHLAGRQWPALPQQWHGAGMLAL